MVGTGGVESGEQVSSVTGVYVGVFLVNLDRHGDGRLYENHNRYHHRNTDVVTHTTQWTLTTPFLFIPRTRSRYYPTGKVVDREVVTIKLFTTRCPSSDSRNHVHVPVSTREWRRGGGVEGPEGGDGSSTG